MEGSKTQSETSSETVRGINKQITTCIKILLNGKKRKQKEAYLNLLRSRGFKQKYYKEKGVYSVARDEEE